MVVPPPPPGFLLLYEPGCRGAIIAGSTFKYMRSWHTNKLVCLSTSDFRFMKTITSVSRGVCRLIHRRGGRGPRFGGGGGCEGVPRIWLRSSSPKYFRKPFPFPFDVGSSALQAPVSTKFLYCVSDALEASLSYLWPRRDARAHWDRDRMRDPGLCGGHVEPYDGSRAFVGSGRLDSPMRKQSQSQSVSQSVICSVSSIRHLMEAHCTYLAGEKRAYY